MIMYKDTLENTIFVVIFLLKHSLINFWRNVFFPYSIFPFSPFNIFFNNNLNLLFFAQASNFKRKVIHSYTLNNMQNAFTNMYNRIICLELFAYLHKIIKYV